MLIGLSISKCIADIMQQKVNPDDVFLIVGRTDFHLEHIDGLIEQYQSYRGEWYDFDREDLKELLTDFYKQGKIHQPRQFGVNPPVAPRSKHWMRVVYEPHDLTETAQKAWDRFVMLAALTK